LLYTGKSFFRAPLNERAFRPSCCGGNVSSLEATFHSTWSAAIFGALFDGESWSQTGDRLPWSMGKMVWALAASPADPALVYAGYGQSDKGQAETRKMPTGPGAPWFSGNGGDH
jgi:hypothetical protein